MTIKKLYVVAASFSLFVMTHQANALTVQQYKDACATQETNCDQHPILNAYIGGALDLLASLQDETDYLSTLYCKQPEELFDIKKISNFIENSDTQHNNKNAMLLLIAYFEEHGGC